jgi:hypothetical protein
MSLPDWVHKRLSYIGELKRHTRDDEPFLALLEGVLDRHALVGLPLVPVNTNQGSVEVVWNRRTGEPILLWDYQFFLHFDISLAILLASERTLARAQAEYMLLRGVSVQTTLNLLSVEPGLALSCERMSGAIHDRPEVPDRIRVPDQSLFDRIRTLCRVFVLLHELGHVTYRSHSSVVENIDDKLTTVVAALKQSQQRFISERDGDASRHDRDEHIGKIEQYLASPDRRLETWCDLYAVEQLLLWCFIEGYTPSECYLAVMLTYYLIHTRQLWAYFWNRHNASVPWSENERIVESAIRGDVRGQFCMLQGHNIWGGALKVTYENYSQAVGKDCYVLMDRYRSLVRRATGLILGADRPKHFAHSDQYWHSLPAVKQREALVYLRKASRWTI